MDDPVNFAQLVQFRAPANLSKAIPNIGAPGPSSHRTSHLLPIVAQERPKEGAGHGIDVVPPRSVDDELFIKLKAIAATLKLAGGASRAQFDGRVTFFAKFGGVPNHQDVGPPFLRV